MLAKKSFAPRFGVAYQLTNKTVVRAGYGIFYIQLDGNRESEFISPPFIVRESGLLNQVDASGVPQRTTQTILAGAQFSPRPNLFAHSPYDGNFGYSQEWNFFVQRALPGNFVIDAGYVGNRGNRLQQTRPLNVPRPGPGPVDPRRPYPEFNTISFSEQSGYSIYHAFQTKLERRFSAGLSTSLAYTRSKLIDLNTGNSSTGFDPYNLSADRGLADYDSPNIFSGSVVYELPFLRNAANKLLRTALGGWTTTSFITASNGYPFTPSWSGDTGNRGAGSRPDRICNGKLDNPTRERWFDTSCFVVPVSQGPFSIGNTGRVSFAAHVCSTGTSASTRISSSPSRDVCSSGQSSSISPTQPTFGLPGTTINAGTPGVITTAGPARIIQFGLKLYF